MQMSWLLCQTCRAGCYATQVQSPEVETGKSIAQTALNAADMGFEIPPTSVPSTSQGTVCTFAPHACDGSATASLTLDLSYAGLSGTLPTELLTLTRLQTLDLSDNYLSGTLPSELGLMTSLSFDVNLEKNYWISGSVPTEIGQLSGLSNNLQLWRNRLSGTYPSEMTRLRKLKGVYMEVNYLSGWLPTEVGLMSTELTHNLGQSYNYLSGFVPTEIGRLSKLQRTVLVNVNRFSGTLPPELHTLTKLAGLLVYSNRLSGTIPASFVPGQPGLVQYAQIPGRVEGNHFGGVGSAVAAAATVAPPVAVFAIELLCAGLLVWGVARATQAVNARPATEADLI